MASAVNFSNHVKSMISTMPGMQRILYVGTDIDIADYPALIQSGWRCIFTAQKAADFADAFSIKDRQVRQILSADEYEAEVTKLDRGNPMLVFINGLDAALGDTEVDDDIEAFLAQGAERESLIAKLEKLLSSGLMVELVMVGYDPDNNEDITPKDLYSIVKNLNDNRIKIYGLSEDRENHRIIRHLEDKGYITVFSQDLGKEMEKHAAPMYEYDDVVIPTEPEEYKHSVYINGAPKIIDPATCRDFDKYGRVLSLHEMHTAPISRMMQVDYFYKFLKYSPNAPQWYGYSPRNGFSVHREFEDELYRAVVEGLESNSEIPIILSGQTSSGKSVALSSLAYKIFNAHRYPVVYVNNPDVVFSINTPAGISLDNLLKEMRDCGGRTLVVLDWSVFNLQRSDLIRRISDAYINRGHNVLFVASAMHTEGLEKRYRIIQAPIALSENEKKAFKELVVDKAKLPRNKVEQWMKANENDNGLLSMLYRLIYELRPQLEHGIRKEINLALEDTKQELERLDAPIPKEQPLTAFAAALMAAGYIKQRDEEAEQLSDQKQTIIDSLHPFCKSVAVATLFKLRMPMTLAIKLLKIPDCENADAYRTAVFSAPWIFSAMDDDKYSPGAYYVSFRDPVDAAIYLTSIGVSEADRLEIIAHIIASINSDDSPYYNDEVRFLERLIRMVGPNSDDERVRSNWKWNYGDGCPAVIDALQALRQNGIVEPQLVAQEITYIREYYGQVNSDDLNREALSTASCWLEKAISIAREVRDVADYVDGAPFAHQGILDSITVESIFAELRYEDCLARAQELDIPLSQSEGFTLSTYDQRFSTLMEVIDYQPDNSYAYTALLSSFLKRYQRIVVEKDERFFKDMSDILAVVDATEATIPAVEQNEHYQKLKNQYFQFFDQVNKDSERASQYFDKLLLMGSPVGIHMKARTILRNAYVNCNEAIRGRSAHDACVEALGVLECPEYAPILRGHAASQFLRLQLTWLIRNKQPIFDHERQVTYMNQTDWAQLYGICRQILYTSTGDKVDSHYNATVRYIMALSCAQLERYDEAVALWTDIPENAIHTSSRQRTWHVLSTPDGTPLMYEGTFNRRGLQERRLYVKGMERPVLFPSLQSIGVSSPKGDVYNLCVGTSFRGFSVFSTKWLSTRGEQNVSR